MENSDFGIKFAILCLLVNGMHFQVIKNLQETILKDYNKNFRPPIADGSFAAGVEVFATIVPYYLVEVRDNEGASTLVIYLFLYWNDPRLAWDPRDHNGTDYIDLDDSKMVWKPKVTFAAILRQEDIMNGMQWFGVNYQGFVQAGHYFRLEQDNMEFAAVDFPFDMLNMSIFLITPYSLSTVSLNINNLSYPKPQNMKMIVDWKFQNFSCGRDVRQSVWLKTPVNYTYIGCLLQVQRQPAHYLINFCIPCQIVSVLAVLGIHSASSVTTTRTSKYELGVASLMSIWLLALPITDIMPRTGTLTRLHIFYFGLVGTVLSATVMSWVSVVCQRRNFHRKSTFNRQLNILRAEEDRKRLRRMFRILDLVSVIVHLGAQGILMSWFCNLWKLS